MRSRPSQTRARRAPITPVSPLFACFPVCMTLTAIGFVAVLVVATGTVNSIPGDDQPTDETTRPGHGPPRWWVAVLIFVAVVAVYLLLWWLADDSPPG